MDDADRKAILTALAAVREPESFGVLSGYLGNAALRETAAAALLDLASEQAPHERWLSGHEAVSVLRRLQASLPDPADRENLDRIIVERLRQGGFAPLFDGRGLSGWKGLVADPPARARMTAAELAKAQAEADERMRAHWKVVDGVLVFEPCAQMMAQQLHGFWRGRTPLESLSDPGTPACIISREREKGSFGGTLNKPLCTRIWP